LCGSVLETVCDDEIFLVKDEQQME
jgi:hypothetical protein